MPNRKKKKTSQKQRSAQPARQTGVSDRPPTKPQAPETASPLPASNPLQPEQISLKAYEHIQKCMRDHPHLSKEKVTAVIQLSQHLRVFGLLSAVGYVRHARDGTVRGHVRPMWTPLLWHLVFSETDPPDRYDQQTRQALMSEVYSLSKTTPRRYMVLWRQALKLSNHWGFWARAHQEETQETQINETH